jgi:hypothetical protein
MYKRSIASHMKHVWSGLRSIASHVKHQWSGLQIIASHMKHHWSDLRSIVSHTLQIIVDLCIREKELAKTRSQISFIYFYSHS